MATELAVIEDINQSEVPALFETKDTIQQIIDKIRAEVTSVVADVSTPSGRKEIASIAHKVAKSKTTLDNLGKGLVEGIKQQAKVIDESRKLARDQLDELKAEVRQPLTDWENAEKARIQGLESRLDNINRFVEGICSDASKDLKESLKTLEAIKVDDSWQEYKAGAAVAKDASVSALKELIERTEKREAEQAELERLRKESAEREAKEAAERQQREEVERKEREEQLRREREALIKAQAEKNARAEERRKIEAEKAAKDLERVNAERRAAEAERKAAEAELKANQAAEAERRRIAEEEKQKRVEAERREADIEHTRKMNNESVDDLVSAGLTSSVAKKAVTAIANGSVRNIRISY